MQITHVKIYPINAQDGLIGFADIVIDDWLRLSSIGIYRRLDGTGYRLTYPTKKAGRHDQNLFHPLNDVGSSAIEQAIFTALKAVNQRSNDRYRGTYPDSVTI